MTEQQLDCALDLMRRLPPRDIESNLSDLLDLAPDLTEQLLSSVDQPLKIAHDPKLRRDYLLCDYNRDGDSYRSPWSNEYDPPLSDGALPSDKLRELEVEANHVFDVYRDLYYEGGVSSVYCWDLDGGFAACILIKKTQDQSKSRQPMKGAWDSIHVVEVVGGLDAKDKATYKLTSTVMLSIETNSTGATQNLSGSLTRLEEREMKIDPANTHISNIGRMVEDMEIKLRTTLEQIYFGKTKDVVSSELRNQVSSSVLAQRAALTGELGKSLAKRS